jgi:uncharacterized protein (TIGR02246 family)
MHRASKNRMVGALTLSLLLAGGVWGSSFAREGNQEDNPMQETNASERAIDVADEAALRAIPVRMVEAWNRGSSADFAAPFTDTADFIAFEGTHLKGRRAIADFHRQIFAGEVKGTRLEGEAKFVQFLSPELAVMHAVARVWLVGEQAPSPSRDSMQLFVARKRQHEWLVDAVLNARQLTLERQLFLDQFDAMSAQAQRRVIDWVASATEKP